MATDTSKISKKVKSNINFVFIVLSETVNDFVSFGLVLEIQNAVSFAKTHFY